MPALPIALTVDAATFAGLDPDDYPDGQRAVVTDDGDKEYEGLGADGARVWVLLHHGHVADHQAAWDHDEFLTVAEADTLYAPAGSSTELVVSEVDSSPPVTVHTEDGTDWVYTEPGA